MTTKEWCDQYARSDEPLEGFPYGGWESPEETTGSFDDDPLSVAQWDWLDTQCPDGYGVDYDIQKTVRRSTVPGWERSNIVFSYIWFADETTATLYRVRFGA